MNEQTLKKKPSLYKISILDVNNGDKTATVLFVPSFLLIGMIPQQNLPNTYKPGTAMMGDPNQILQLLYAAPSLIATMKKDMPVDGLEVKEHHDVN